MLPQFVFRKTIYIVNVLSLFIVWTTIYIADLYFHLFCGAPFTLRICCLHLLSERTLIITDLLSSFVVLDRHFHCRFFAFIYCPNIVDLFFFFSSVVRAGIDNGRLLFSFVVSDRHLHFRLIIFICCPDCYLRVQDERGFDWNLFFFENKSPKMNSNKAKRSKFCKLPRMLKNLQMKLAFTCKG